MNDGTGIRQPRRLVLSSCTAKIIFSKSLAMTKD